MDEATYKKRVKRLKEVDKVVKALDPAIREASFKLLQSHITNEKLHDDSGGSGDGSGGNGGASGKSIFTEFEHDRPSDNVLLVAAYHFSQYGSVPFSIEEAKVMATDAGLTIPNRPNMTLRTASRKGKKLFARAGRGKFKPTVHGERYLKETYKVSKGGKKKLGEGDE